MKEYIYSIQSKATSKIYIGRSYQPKQRFLNHISCLKRNVHTSSKLQVVFDSHGVDDLLFNIIDSTTSDKILDLEEHWLSKINSEFSLNIVFKSTGGRKLSAKQREHRALNYCEILDIGFKTRLGLNKLAKQFGVSSGVLLKYKAEWEQLRGVKYEHPQVKSTKERMELFSAAYELFGVCVMKSLNQFKLSVQAIKKYSGEFGIDWNNLKLDQWKEESRAKAFAAYEYKSKTNCTVSEARRFSGATVTTYYKYLPEWKKQNKVAMSSMERAKQVVEMVNSGITHMQGACKQWRIARDTVKKYHPEMFA